MAIGVQKHKFIKIFGLGPHSRYATLPPSRFSIFYINFYIANSEKIKNDQKGVLFWYFLFRKKNVDKTSQNWCIFYVVGHFWRNMYISEGVKILKNWRNPRFWPPSEMTIFRQKRPNVTKIHQFWEVLSTFFPLNKKYQNTTPFWSFLIFSLLAM